MQNQQDTDKGWVAWSMYLIKSVETIQKDVSNLYDIANEDRIKLHECLNELKDEVYRKINEIKIDLAKLQVKAGMIGGFLGALGGAILTVIVFAVRQYIMKM